MSEMFEKVYDEKWVNNKLTGKDKNIKTLD